MRMKVKILKKKCAMMKILFTNQATVFLVLSTVIFVVRTPTLTQNRLDAPIWNLAIEMISTSAHYHSNSGSDSGNSSI